MNKVFLMIFVLSVHNIWAQINDKQAFKQLKKLQGIWQMQASKETIYEEWTIDDKSSLQSKRYKINNTDTVLLHLASIQYSRRIRFVHPSTIHYNIKTLNSDVIYPFRLEKVTDGSFVFSNFNNEALNTITFQLSEQTLQIQLLSKDESKKETLNFRKIK